MRASRWVAGLGALGVVGTSALVLGASSPAAADDTRYNLSARGDAFYFEVNGDEIPASPKNDAGSLTAAAETKSSGGSTGYAGMPYWGNTVQYLPGTLNGIPNQFGAPDLQIPFAVLPGYVSTSSTGTPEASEDFGFGRIESRSAQDGASSSASYGAPGSIPTPNQQQTANATTESTGTTVSAVASGSSSGFVSGPLEVGHSTAIASIKQTVGRTAQVESKTFGRFAVNGQEFGFDQNGFRYLGQGMSSEDAIAGANSALNAAGIALELAPVVTDKDETGRTTYSIGGLMVTTTQDSPSGAGTFTVTYVLGRASVGAGVARIGFGTAAGAAGSGTAAATDGAAVSDGVADTAIVPSLADRLPAALTAALPAGLAADAAAVPSAVLQLGADGALVPVGEVVAGQALPKVLGVALSGSPTGARGEWLYAPLLLAGVVFLVARFGAVPGRTRSR